MPKNIDLNLRDVYRASDVARWQIAKTDRAQSLSDHSFQVAMIAMRIAQLQTVPVDTGKLLWAALTHDLPELLTGDLASPLKDLLGSGFREKLKEFEKSVLVLGKDCGPLDEDFAIQSIVKMADTIEAIKFLHENIRTEHGFMIKQRFEKIIRRDPVGTVVLDEILGREQTTLDSIVYDDRPRDPRLI